MTRQHRRPPAGVAASDLLAWAVGVLGAEPVPTHREEEHDLFFEVPTAEGGWPERYRLRLRRRYWPPHAKADVMLHRQQGSAYSALVAASALYEGEDIAAVFPDADQELLAAMTAHHAARASAETDNSEPPTELMADADVPEYAEPGVRARVWRGVADGRERIVVEERLADDGVRLRARTREESGLRGWVAFYFGAGDVEKEVARMMRGFAATEETPTDDSH